MGSRQHMLTGLTPFTSYSMEVAAVNDGSTGPYSDPALQNGEYMKSVHSVVVLPSFCFICVCNLHTLCIHNPLLYISMLFNYYSMLYIKKSW